MRDDYEERQLRMDREYVRAADQFIASATPAQIRELIDAGIVKEIPVKGGSPRYILADTDRDPAPTSGVVVLGHEGDAATMCDLRVDLATIDDVAARCDGLREELMERFRLDAHCASSIAQFIQARIDRAEQEVHARVLSRVVGVLIESTNNQQARAHALLHAIPRLAAINGFSSMRASADECNCSVEWIRKMRARWCRELGIPIPDESSKSPEARAKYSQAATSNHWRKQKCKPSVTGPLTGGQAT